MVLKALNWLPLIKISTAAVLAAWYMVVSSFSLLAVEQCPGSYSPSTWTECEGALTFVNGDQYAGDYYKGLKHGSGSYRYASGHTYIGEWKSDQPSGQGVFTFSNGDRYVGTMLNGKRHGPGTYHFSTGTQIEGIWQTDQVERGPSGYYGDKRGNPSPSVSSGTAFAISKRGYVVTNHHVVEKCSEMFLFVEDNSYKIRKVSSDTENDISILQGDFTLPTVFPLSDKDPQLLQEIYVAGFPFGLEISSLVKVTKGIVSSLAGIGTDYSAMQIDAAIQPGNSGGPILDTKGNALGMVVAKMNFLYSLKNFNTLPESTNFGVKANAIRALAEKNNISLVKSNTQPLSNERLVDDIEVATFLIYCSG